MEFSPPTRVLLLAVATGTAVGGALTHGAVGAFLLVFVFTGAFVLRTGRPWPGGTRTPGKVVRVEITTDSDGDRLAAPVVEFSTPEGVRTVTSSISSSSAPTVGSAVEVSYPPGRPELARLLSRSAIVFAAMFGGMGLAFTMAVIADGDAQLLILAGTAVLVYDNWRGGPHVSTLAPLPSSPPPPAQGFPSPPGWASPPPQPLPHLPLPASGWASQPPQPPAPPAPLPAPGWASPPPGLGPAQLPPVVPPMFPPPQPSYPPPGWAPSGLPTPPQAAAAPVPLESFLARAQLTPRNIGAFLAAAMIAFLLASTLRVVPLFPGQHQVFPGDELGEVYVPPPPPPTPTGLR